MRRYDSIWSVDFEYATDANGLPHVLCMVAKDIATGRLVRMWRDELVRQKRAPFPTGPRDLMVAFSARAELDCFLALGWPFPDRVLDLYFEQAWLINGVERYRPGLLKALTYHGLPAIDAAEKSRWRDLALRGGPYSTDEKRGLLDYCLEDVLAAERLLGRLVPACLNDCVPSWTLDRAVMRGEYAKTLASMYRVGIPVDLAIHDELMANWTNIQRKLIEQSGVAELFEGTTFKQHRFGEYLNRMAIQWPRTAGGRLELSIDTFRDYANLSNEFGKIYELRKSLKEMRSIDLEIYADERNRCYLNPFGSRTGRNQPGSTRFIFGPARFLRNLIRPPEDYGLAYLDYTSQEVGIMAAQSGDANLAESYRSGDPYLAFAKLAGLAPTDATKASHGPIRDQCKAAVLATNYGMSEKSLATRIQQSTAHARELLEWHHKVYARYWDYVNQHINATLQTGYQETKFGWPERIGEDPNVRSIQNFPAQANGAEILRLACNRIVQAGIEVCAPVHDAVLIQAPLEVLDKTIEEAQQIMRSASREILGGFEIGTDAEKVISYPNRYYDGSRRGADTFWNLVMGVLGRSADNVVDAGS